MFLEVVLYFVLGFFVASLLALMISPVIWNRAVELTRQKIESSVPLSVNEIQADKDQLRAEFAMSTRRLEISIDDLREKAAEQLIEINRKRDQAAKYDADMKERLKTISDLEAKASDMRSRLSIKEAELEATNLKQEKLEEQFAKTSEELSKMRQKFQSTEAELSSKRVELNAKNSKIDSLVNTFTNIDVGSDEGLEKFRELGLELANVKEQLDAEKQRVKEAELRAKLAKEEAESAISKLEAREQDLNSSRVANGEDSSNILDLNEQLIDEKAKIVELEAKLAKQKIQTEALLNDASNENVRAAMSTINADMEEKINNVKKLEKERDTLKSQLDLLTANANSNWSDERQENAVLRERINDMAAQITAMTMEVEGKSSPLHDILAKDKNGKKSGNGASEERQKDNTISLAERIRAIQNSAS
jgi:hypothetical protein